MHADYEAIIDGANIALYQQNFADGGFCLSQVHSLFTDYFAISELLDFCLPVLMIFCILYSLIEQLDTVVRELYKRSQSKWPLVILHNKRCQALMENPSNRQLLDTWRAEGALYTTPNGSNDDW